MEIPMTELECKAMTLFQKLTKNTRKLLYACLGCLIAAWNLRKLLERQRQRAKCATVGSHQAACS